MGRVQSIVARFLRWPIASPASSEAAHLALGRWGENEASQFLKNAGYKILRRNFRGPHGGEVDIVCRDQEVLVFVEVKTRTDEQFGSPSKAVNRKKQRLIVKAAMVWLRMLDMPDIAFRFDIIEVLDEKPTQIHHIESAFTLPHPFHY